VRRLLALYPARWRQRYGTEMTRLLEDLAPFSPATRLRVAADLARGAIGAHLSKEFGMIGEAGRVILRGAVVAVLTWIPVATLIVLSNVVFPSRGDHDGPWLLGGYLIIFAAFACAGLTRTSTEGRIAAGAVAGIILGVLTIATFAAVDNIFLPIVSQQQAKITGFHQSGMTSMRAYINSSLVPAGIFFSIEFAIFGTLLAAAGGDLYDRRTRMRRGDRPQPHLTP
jgi:hypothetical protein